MNDIIWAIIVVAAFVVFFKVKGWWQKDNQGAIAIALGIIVLGALLLVVTGCAIRREYRPWLEAGLAHDFAGTVGNNPACVVRLRQPLVPGRVVASYTHHSSCPDLRDKNTVDQLEAVFIVPLGRVAGE